MEDSVALSDSLMTKLLDEANNACSICGRANVKIHHIDGDPFNNGEDNLIILCQAHHDEAEKSRARDFRLSPYFLFPQSGLDQDLVWSPTVLGSGFDDEKDIRYLDSLPDKPVSQVTTQLGAPVTQPHRILIVTVTKVEAVAVLETFCGSNRKTWERWAIENHTYYDLGKLGGVPLFMVQSEMGVATPGGTLLTVHQAIQDLRPQAVIMCGVAFGLRPDKQKLGDILVAKQIQYYEPQKLDLQRGPIPRGDRATSAERLLDRFRSGDNDWKGAQTHFGLVLSGEKLVNVSDFRDWLLKIEPEAVGGEMEGAGLYAAARNAKVDWILVKAICDWADGNKVDDAQPKAARNAAQFVLHVLQLGGLGGSEQLLSP